MSIALTQGEDSSRVQLEGAIDIADAAELKSALLEALRRKKPVEVALDGVTSLDVTAVQLLWAARREAAKAAVRFDLPGGVPETVCAALADAGFREVLLVS